jgi:hypothetical protein
MATRTEKRFGELSAVGLTYVIVGAAVPSSTTWNMLVHVTNRTTSSSLLRLYIADATWTTGEPTSTALKVALAYDFLVAPGDSVVVCSGIIVKATEQIVARSSVASSLDISLHGVEIT